MCCKSISSRSISICIVITAKICWRRPRCHHLSTPLSNPSILTKIMSATKNRSYPHFHSARNATTPLKQDLHSGFSQLPECSECFRLSLAMLVISCAMLVWECGSDDNGRRETQFHFTKTFLLEFSIQQLLWLFSDFWFSVGSHSSASLSDWISGVQ